MTGREKPKRKALHRGLDDIVNRDASLTSKLLGRVKPPAREPLEMPPAEDASDAQDTGRVEDIRAAAAQPRARPLTTEPATVHRLEAARSQGAPARESDASREVAPPKSAAGGAVPAFAEFVARWGFVLRSGGRAGKLRICEVLYNNTYAIGKDTFFTSYEKLAKLAGLEKKQCAINVKQLESLGFIERRNIYNTATRQGTEFKLHLDQLPPAARKVPRYHYYDEDLPPNL